MGWLCPWQPSKRLHIQQNLLHRVPTSSEGRTEIPEELHHRSVPANHKRKDCTSGHDPKHPDFNEEGKWVGCATYKTIKTWLASHDRAGKHPTLRFNYRADGTPNGAQAEGEAGSTIPNRPQVESG